MFARAADNATVWGGRRNQFSLQHKASGATDKTRSSTSSTTAYFDEPNDEVSDLSRIKVTSEVQEDETTTKREEEFEKDQKVEWLPSPSQSQPCFSSPRPECPSLISPVPILDLYTQLSLPPDHRTFIAHETDHGIRLLSSTRPNLAIFAPQQLDH